MKFFVIAGEKSGDKQGALVMQELMNRCPDIQFEGLGGNRMHALALRWRIGQTKLPLSAWWRC